MLTYQRAENIHNQSDSRQSKTRCHNRTCKKKSFQLLVALLVRPAVWNGGFSGHGMDCWLVAG